MDRQKRQEGEAAMLVRNYREVRAEPVVKEPGVAVHWLVSELDEAPNFALRLYEMEPGAATAAHSHYWEQDVFVLSGTGAVIGEEGEIPLGTGDLVYVPPGEQHQFVNSGDRVLRLLMVLPIVHQTPVLVG
jgi:quercetin dioxygenase-like cupin family protein